jgi:hypothetical protein
MELLTNILANLRKLAWAQGSHRTGEVAAIFFHLCNYFVRASTRILRLYTIWQQGRLTPTRPRVRTSVPPVTQSQDSVPPARPRLPRRRAWLLKALQHHGAREYALLRQTLDDPDFAAFLRDVPRAARYLRPLWHMLGADPVHPAIALPPRPRPPRTPKAPRTPAPPLRRPLEPYVQAAARAWKRQDTRLRRPPASPRAKND